MGCVFCDIAAGSVPATVVAADDRAVAIADIRPQAPTHVLVLPREHVASVVDADPELVAHLLAMAIRVAREEQCLEAGFRLVVNTGDDGGQTVPHLHVHLLAGRRLGWPPG